LVGISSAIALVGWIIARNQKERDEAVALERAQDESLRAYLDQMSNLIVDQGLLGKALEDSSGHTVSKVVQRQTGVVLLTPVQEHVRKVAQARTLAILLGLDGEHKRRPLKLVYELGLINANTNGNRSVLNLTNAGLDHANLSELALREANLECADLRATDLNGSDLNGSDLSGADLRGADLSRADLKGADLTGANLLPYDERDPERLSLHNLRRINLSEENLRPRKLTLGDHRRVLAIRNGKLVLTTVTKTDLRRTILSGARLYEAYLSGADLRDADLRDADLRGADLSGVDLRGAQHLTQRQIEQAIGDRQTRLPERLRLPKSWRKNASRRG
jgi:uncharacterized protein YjbI with pentapeptide repeats